MSLKKLNPMTLKAASRIQSSEAKRSGGGVQKGSFSSRAQSAAAKNSNTGYKNKENKLNMSNKRHLFKHQLTISSQSIMRGSDVKKLKQKLLDTYKNITSDQIDLIINKKKDIGFVKLPNKIQIISQENNPIFFEYYDKLYPTIYTFFKVPTFFTIIYIYPLVYQYIESGADLMFQGIINKEEVPKQEGQLVSICLKGSNYPIAFGETIQNITMPIATADNPTPQTEYKGKAVSIIHYLNDKLWEYGTKKLPDDFSIPKDSNSDDNDNDDDENEQDSDNKEVEKKENDNVTTTTTTTTTTNNNNNNNNDNGSNNLEKSLNELKVEENNNNNNDNVSKEEMDEILLTSFLGAIKKGISDSELPIVLKTVFSKYMLYYQPLGKPEINLKKSSYKKVSVFMKEMEKKGLIDLKEPTPGNIVISRIFRNNILYGKFKLGEIVGPNNVNGDDNGDGGDNNNEDNSDDESNVFGSTEKSYIPIKQVNEVYLLPKSLKEYLKEKQLEKFNNDGNDNQDDNNDDDDDDDDEKDKLIEKLNRKYYQASEIQKIVSNYIIEFKLEDPIKRSKLKIDSFLLKLLPTKNQQQIPINSLLEKGQFFTMFKESLKKYLEIVRQDQSIEYKEFNEIQIQVKKISNRFVILVSNLELFDIPIKELQQEGMKLFAASTSIDQLNNHKSVLKIQGNDLIRVSQHIQKKYNIPKKYIIEQEFQKQKK